jgi:hypothetical protein
MAIRVQAGGFNTVFFAHGAGGRKYLKGQGRMQLLCCLVQHFLLHLTLKPN